MDVLTFISELVKALAWPLAAIAVAGMFQAQIRALLARIVKGKFGAIEFEAQVERIADKVAQQAVEDQSASPGGPAAIDHADPELQPLVTMAQHDPRGTVLVAWIAVEKSLLALARAKGLSRATGPLLNPTRRMDYLVDKQAISRADADLFNELRQLRNRTAHGELEPTYDSAVSFATLATGLAHKFENLARGSVQ